MDQIAGQFFRRLFIGKVSFLRNESFNFPTVLSLVANILSGILAA